MLDTMVHDKCGIFGVFGNRPLTPGALLRFGEECFYVKSTQYFSSSNKTRINIYPQTEIEVGSRASGAASNNWISDHPIALSVDGVETEGSPGFLMTIGAAFPYAPADKGSLKIIFTGDMSLYAQAGHLLEFDGRPYRIQGSQVLDSGTKTEVTLTSPLRVALTLGKTVRLSVRPIFDQGSLTYAKLGPTVSDQPIELVQYDSDGFGTTLVPNKWFVLLGTTVLK